MNARLSKLFAFSGYVGLSLLLAYRGGQNSWAAEGMGALDPRLVELFATSAPLPAPLYTLDNALFALLASACLFALARLGLAILRGLFRLGSRGRGWQGRGVALGESGQAMTEVVVSFPVLLITTLILMQLALMYQAKNVVTYAAFSAVRAAIVWIPAESDTEGKHQLNVDTGEKIDKIQQAAAMACVPISPAASTVLEGLPVIGDLIADAFDAFSGMLSSFGLAGSYADAALQRFAYSAVATEVTIYKSNQSGYTEVSGTEEWRYPDGHDVGVLVEHRYYLPIPLVNRFIGEEWTVFGMGPIGLSLPGRFSNIRATAFLPLEGETGGPDDSWAAPPIDGFWD